MQQNGERLTPPTRTFTLFAPLPDAKRLFQRLPSLFLAAGERAPGTRPPDATFMNYFNSSKRLAARTLVLSVFFVLLFSAQHLFAQSSPSVRREQLLNGLNVLLLPHSGEAKFLLKLQIKSGAAFDLAGKEGTMALLGDALVPDQSAREDIAESMDGSIDVSTTYDAINLTITGREIDFERYVELLRNVLLNTPLAAENVDKLRAARVNLLRQTSVSPAVMADRAVATRLFGTYPYGRPTAGTPEALARVTRSDLLLARDRFLTADNSTLLLASNLDSRRVMRAFRQLLGSWRRSEKIVPATFRQPGPFDARTLIVDLPGAESVELRLATRGFARRQSEESLAAALLAGIAQERWMKVLQTGAGMPPTPVFVRHDAHALGGIFVLGTAVPLAAAPQALETMRATARSLGTTPATPDELARGKSALIAQLDKELNAPDALGKNLLDHELYQLRAGRDAAVLIGALGAAELSRAATQLFPDEHAAAVAVGPASALSATLARDGSIEILGAETPAPAAPPNPPASNTAKSPAKLLFGVQPKSSGAGNSSKSDASPAPPPGGATPKQP